MSRERMCTMASAEPVTVPASTTSGTRGQDPLELLRGDGAAAEQLDVGLGAEPVDGGVDLDREGPDDAVGDEAVDATFYCGGGEADPLPDVAVARTRVLAEHVEDAVVEIVHTGTLRRFIAWP